jgi:flavorubredoxin
MRVGGSKPDAAAMQTNVHEIADGVHRLSTCIPEVAPGGFTFNQYLIDAEEPLLFHTGPRQMFDLVAPAAAQVLDLDRLRWISFGHVESDECGAMNRWLEAAPQASVTFNGLGVDVSLADLADRPPVVASDTDPLDIGGHRLHTIPTPHVPHGWEAQVMYDETTGTLFCGDLLTQIGDGPALVHDVDLIEPALAAEDMFGATCLTAATAPTLRRLADLAPRTLALMHGPAFVGDCARALRELADAYDERFRATLREEAAA